MAQCLVRCAADPVEAGKVGSIQGQDGLGGVPFFIYSESTLVQTH